MPAAERVHALVVSHWWWCTACEWLTPKGFILEPVNPHLMHPGKPTGVAVSHCITWFQIQPMLTTCQIRHHAIVGSS